MTHSPNPKVWGKGGKAYEKNVVRLSNKFKHHSFEDKCMEEYPNLVNAYKDLCPKLRIGLYKVLLK